jgi:putative PIN family toxin of toxin-antitoxin system
VRKVVDEAQLLISDATLSELASVLARPKFDSYLSVAARQEFIRLVGRVAERVAIVYAVRACRNPKDDMFLELAVNGSADLIVTGDTDLLSIGNYQGVRIISPAHYLSD